MEDEPNQDDVAFDSVDIAVHLVRQLGWRSGRDDLRFGIRRVDELRCLFLQRQDRAGYVSGSGSKRMGSARTACNC